MDYHYILGICLLVTSTRTENSFNQAASLGSTQQNETLNFIHEFLIESSGSINNMNHTAPSYKNLQTGLETKDFNPSQLPTFKDTGTTNNSIQMIPVPSVVSSAIDTLPVHPRIPRRSLTRRRTKVRLNRQNKRKGSFAQPVRILLPPFRQKEEMLNSETSEKLIEPSGNSNRNDEVITNIEQSTKVVPITATPTTSNSDSRIQEVNASDQLENKNVPPQFHKVFISPPLRFLLPPLFYENYVNAQTSTTPRTDTDDKKIHPSNIESESSGTFNIESRPVSRLPILIIEDPSEFPVGTEQGSNLRYSTPNPLNNFRHRDVELINNLQSSKFKNHLLISVTTEITPFNTQHTSFANSDKYKEHNPVHVNHSLQIGGTQSIQGNNQDNYQKQQQQQFVHHNQQSMFENQTFFVPPKNNQLAPANENVINLNPNRFDTNAAQNNQPLQPDQEFSTGSLPQQGIPINNQQKDMQYQFDTPHENHPNFFNNNHSPNVNMNQFHVLNSERESDFQMQNLPPLNYEQNKKQNSDSPSFIQQVPQNFPFNQQEQFLNLQQQPHSPNDEMPNHMKLHVHSNNQPQTQPNKNQPQLNLQNLHPHTSSDNEHHFHDRTEQTENNPLSQNPNNNQQQELENDNQEYFSPSNRNQDNFPLHNQKISLVLQPPFEDVNDSPQENTMRNPFSVQQTFSLSNQHQNSAPDAPQAFSDSSDTLGFNTNGNPPQTISDHQAFPIINSSANIENTHFEYHSNEATTPGPQFSSAPALSPVLRGPNIEQALFETGNFHIFENISTEPLDPMLAMMDKPLLTKDIFETGMKIMVMNKEKINKMKVNRGNIKYKHLNQFNLFSDRDSSTNGGGSPTVLVVAETSYYNIPRGAVELYHDSEIRVIPGRPGRDYPTLNEPPSSSDFSCRSVKQHRGYVADPATRCQVFYICVGAGPGEAMLCPNGTLFSQDYLVCDWWYNIDCQPYS